jgi:hypothetical protein
MPKYTLYAWRSDDEGGLNICKCEDFTPSRGYNPESGWRARPSEKIGDFDTAEELAALAEISVEEAAEWLADFDPEARKKHLAHQIHQAEQIVWWLSYQPEMSYDEKAQLERMTAFLENLRDRL